MDEPTAGPYWLYGTVAGTAAVIGGMAFVLIATALALGAKLAPPFLIFAGMFAGFALVHVGVVFVSFAIHAARRDRLTP